MSEIADIIERLEKATGPDLDLDHAIASALSPEDGHGVLLYTASIDAALTLVPLREDGANCWGIELDRGFEAYVSRNNVKSGHWLVQGCAKTPAIALCIAALKALHQPTPLNLADRAHLEK